jgi:hypothetical protein
MGIYQSSGRTRNPLAALSVCVGAVGATASAVLWAYQFDPNGPLVRSIAERLGPGLGTGDALVLFAAIFGGMALIFGIATSMGGSGRSSSILAIVLGVFAVSYPILSWFQVFTRPLLHHSLP